MSSHKDWFFIYEKYDGGRVYLGDDSHLEIFGHGKFIIQIPNGIVKGIDDVMHILSFS
jgi:hypothetical protein